MEKSKKILSINEIKKGLIEMNNKKLLADVISNLRSLSNSLEAFVDAIDEEEVVVVEANTMQGSATEEFMENEEMKNEEVEQEEIKEKIKEEIKGKTKKEYTLEDLRSILAVKSQNGFTLEIKKIIEKYGGIKLSDIDPSYYADVANEAEVLGDE